MATLRRVADRMTDWRFHCWYWGDAIAVDGLLEADSLGPGPTAPAVVETLQRWHDHCLPNFDDVLGTRRGDRPTRDGWRSAGTCGRASAGSPRRAADRARRHPVARAASAGVPLRASASMPCTTCRRSTRWRRVRRDDADLARKAVSIAVDSMNVLRCQSGWAQWFDPTRKANNGVAWTRGMGWAVLGLLDLVHAAEGRGTAEAADLAGSGVGTPGRDPAAGWQLGRGARPSAGRQRDVDCVVLRRRRAAPGGTRARRAAGRGARPRDGCVRAGASPTTARSPASPPTCFRVGTSPPTSIARRNRRRGRKARGVRAFAALARADQLL